MIPILDENPTRLRPYVTWLLIGLCVAVFFWQLSFSAGGEERLVQCAGFVPAALFGSGADGICTLPPWSSLITSMFLHGGFLHLGGNMLYLWIFGNNIEDAMGHLKFLLFYFVCGVAAALFEGAIDSGSAIPMLGASGAISGVLASYVMIFPRARVTVIIPLGILLYPTKISAIYVVGFWFVLQLVNIALTAPGTPGTAWWAHVGGFITGLLLTPFLSKFPLFGRFRRGPWG